MGSMALIPRRMLARAKLGFSQIPGGSHESTIALLTCDDHLAASHATTSAVRPISTSSATSAGTPTGTLASAETSGTRPFSPGIFEMRTYNVKPHLLRSYLDETAKFAELRKQLCPGWLGFWWTETGGTIGEVKHLYSYKGGWEQREAARNKMTATVAWSQEYLVMARPMMDRQESMIFVEASDCMRACGLPSASHLFTPPKPDASPSSSSSSSPAPSPPLSPIYELRTYHLDAGYHTVPLLRKHFCEGLPSRISADGAGQCMFMGYTDTGLLNVFIEIWRHESVVHHIKAREGARKAEKWRDTIQAIAPIVKTFRTEILRPAPFSPWQ